VVGAGAGAGMGAGIGGALAGSVPQVGGCVAAVWGSLGALLLCSPGGAGGPAPGPPPWLLDAALLGASAALGPAVVGRCRLPSSSLC